MTRRIPHYSCFNLPVLCLAILLLLISQVYSFAPAPLLPRFVVVSRTAVLTQTTGTRRCDLAVFSQVSSSANKDNSIVNNNSNKNSLVEMVKTWLMTSWKKVQPSPALTSTAWLVALDVAFRQVFHRAKIRFPSSLAGCGVVLVALLLAQVILVGRQGPDNGAAANDDDDAGSALYQTLQPGAALLAQWLPVFFVPSLVTLPLAEGLGSVSDLVKVTLVLLGGFFFSLLTTAYAVTAVRRPQATAAQDETTTTAVDTASSPKLSSSTNDSKSSNDDDDDDDDDDEQSNPAKATPTTSSNKPFSGKLLSQLTLASVVTGLLAQTFVGAHASQFLTGVCFLTTTLASFVFGARLPAAFTKLVHPIVTCTALTWSVVALLANLTGHTFRGLLRCYRTGNVWTGAGDVLLFLLGPAVVSLAVSIFDRRRLVRDNALAVATAVSVATFGGVGATALAVRLCGIGIPAVRLSLLSRNITSPLAMAMASLLGADVSLAVSMVVLTGLVGANFGASILTACGITDPVARGLSMGAAAHGLGTAALARKEPTAFSFSAIAMALVASAATVTVSIPFLRRIVLEVALG